MATSLAGVRQDGGRGRTRKRVKLSWCVPGRGISESSSFSAVDASVVEDIVITATHIIPFTNLHFRIVACGGTLRLHVL